MKQIKSSDNSIPGILIFSGAIVGLALIIATSSEAFMAILALVVGAALIKVVSWLDFNGVFDGPPIIIVCGLILAIIATCYLGICLNYYLGTGIWPR